MIRVQRCVIGIGLALFGWTIALAAPPLTTVQDILFNADGTRFSGTAAISWNSFQASDGSNISAHSVTTDIVNGLLRVQLVPTTNALSPASYTVVYNSGSNQFSENWSVAPSNVPLRVADVRISSPGTVVGGGGSNPPPLTNPIAISDVTGLTAALNLRPVMGTGYTASRGAVIDASGAINSAVGNASDCLHVDGSSGPCGSGGGSTGVSGSFVDGETPAGSLNGTNVSFTLANSPNPSSSLALFRNGILMKQGLDYSVANNSISFLAGATPQANDILSASYRMSVSISGVSFVDQAVPGGTVDGSNLSFTLASAPSPASSLELFRNGVLMKPNLDYTLSGTTILFTTGFAPQRGDILLASYRAAGLN